MKVVKAVSRNPTRRDDCISLFLSDHHPFVKSSRVHTPMHPMHAWLAAASLWFLVNGMTYSDAGNWCVSSKGKGCLQVHQSSPIGSSPKVHAPVPTTPRQYKISNHCLAEGHAKAGPVMDSCGRVNDHVPMSDVRCPL